MWKEILSETDPRPTYKFSACKNRLSFLTKNFPVKTGKTNMKEVVGKINE